MGKIKNEVGNKYNRLTVLEMISERTNRGEVQFICQCDCGNVLTVTGSKLRNNGVKSCGCLKKETSLENIKKATQFIKGNALLRDRSIIIKRRIYNETIVRRHRKKGFNKEELIDFETFSSLVDQNCFFCGSQPCLIRYDRLENSNVSVNHQGLDRIDSNKGYNIDNVVPCCQTCNQAKNILTIEEFYKWIKLVSNFQKDKGNIK